MEIIREHPVELDWLAGKPRWWTVRIKGRQMELVRVDLSAESPDAWPLYIFLPPGAFTHPPLVAPMFRLGEQAFDEVKRLGGKVLHYPTPAGKALELKLMGWKR